MLFGYLNIHSYHCECRQGRALLRGFIRPRTEHNKQECSTAISRRKVAVQGTWSRPGLGAGRSADEGGLSK